MHKTNNYNVKSGKALDRYIRSIHEACDKNENVGILNISYSAVLESLEFSELEHMAGNKDIMGLNKRTYEQVVENTAVFDIVLVISAVDESISNRIEEILRDKSFSKVTSLSNNKSKHIINIDSVSEELKNYLLSKNPSYESERIVSIEATSVVFKCVLPIHELPELKQNLIRYVNLYKLQNSGVYPDPLFFGNKFDYTRNA